MRIMIIIIVSTYIYLHFVIIKGKLVKYNSTYRYIIQHFVIVVINLKQNKEDGSK